MKLSRSQQQMVLNVLFGLSTISWALIGLYQSEPAERATIVRGCTSALNLVVGVLFMVRSTAVRLTDWQSILICLPSLFVCGVAFKLSAPFSQWPYYCTWLFAAGTVFAITALVSLGQSFAVLPAWRKIVTSGPYQFVRHPAYLGELVLVMACCLSRQSFVNLLPILVAIPCVALRIQAEELLLKPDKVFADYQQRVRWRLIPWIW